MEADRSVASAVEPFSKSEIEGSIASRFERVARAHPDRAAVRSPDGGLVTYAELDASADRAARGLCARRDDRSKPVALLLGPGASLFAAMLGALKAGRFYVPLDPSLPPPRLRAILAAISPDVVVTDDAGLSAATAVAGSGMRVRRVEDVLSDGAAGDVRSAADPGDPAYVLFTSGSTGTPKGVVQSHRNVLHNVFKLAQALRIAPTDRMTLLSSPSFGASVTDIYGALLNGAALCPFSLGGDGLRDLPSFVERAGITVYHSVPSVFRSFVAARKGTEDFSSVRVIRLGGEAVRPSDFELYRRHFPRTCRFHVGLGATEMNVIRHWTADHETAFPPGPPLGYAVDETEVRLLDEEGRETSGEGEIAVVGRTLAVGYWNDPVRTAESFVPVPGRPGFRMYRTGDLGRLLPDGCLLYGGRRDSRVKIRGHRVEAAEVEAELARIPGIRESAVVGRDGPGGGTRLVAYVAADASERSGVGSLRRALADRLPDYMIPASFLYLDALPRTPNGKIDRGALPDLDRVRPALETPFVEPRDENDRKAAETFARVLELDRVGADDDFFELGGSSLLAVELLARLSSVFGVTLGVADLIEASTPATLAARARAGRAASGTLLALQRGGDKPPVFLVPGGTGDGQDLLVGARLARRVGPAFPFYGFRSLSDPLPRLDELASRHVAQVRSVQPRGPYRIVGECVGGLLALAMARKLREEGETVALLALLDTPFPTLWRRGRGILERRAPWARSVLLKVAYLAGRIRDHRRVLASLSGGRVAYLFRKARVAARGLASAGGGREQPALRRRASYVGHLMRARVARIDLTIRLIESGEGARSGIGRAWARVASRIEIVRSPGDHTTYLVDHVDRVAETLRRWLDESDGEASPRRI